MRMPRYGACAALCLIVGLGLPLRAVAASSPARAVALTVRDLPAGFKQHVVVNEGMNSFYGRAEYSVSFMGPSLGSPFVLSRVLQDVKVYPSWSAEKFDWTYSQKHECAGMGTAAQFTKLQTHVGKHSFGCAWYVPASQSWQVTVHFRRGVTNVDLTVGWAKSTQASAELVAYRLASLVDSRVQQAH